MFKPISQNAIGAAQMILLLVTKRNVIQYKISSILL